MISKKIEVVKTDVFDFSELTDRERFIVYNYLGLNDKGHPMPLSEIGTRIGVSRERVRQLLEKLRVKLIKSAQQDKDFHFLREWCRRTPKVMADWTGTTRAKVTETAQAFKQRGLPIRISADRPMSARRLKLIELWNSPMPYSWDELAAETGYADAPSTVTVVRDIQKRNEVKLRNRHFMSRLTKCSNPKEFIKLWNGGATAESLASKYGMTVPSVYQKVVKYRHKGLITVARKVRKVTPEMVRTMKDMYHAGETAAHVAKTLKVSVATVSSVAAQHQWVYLVEDPKLLERKVKTLKTKLIHYEAQLRKVKKAAKSK